jgi:hypothetical protein
MIQYIRNFQQALAESNGNQTFVAGVYQTNNNQFDFDYQISRNWEKSLFSGVFRKNGSTLSKLHWNQSVGKYTLSYFQFPIAIV